MFKLEDIYNIFSRKKSRNFLILQGIPALLIISSVENGIVYSDTTYYIQETASRQQISLLSL